ncbi:MAG: DUF368 domain-containing protein [Planctomycetota bacterium]
MSNRETPPLRVLATGFLMGLANLVPGVSGGTMVLAMGLYERFIGAVAELTTLKLSRSLILFLAFLGTGLVVALIGLSGPAVWLVSNYRWVMYSLFIGMTLGGAPELFRLARPLSLPVFVAGAAGLGLMIALFVGLRSASVPHNVVAFALVGALAASSMILPGVSGSYILLIFGMYDVVIGSLSASAIREDVGASAAIVVPVAVGAAAGIGLLSNVLKFFLARFQGPSHGLLLGLLLGAVLGLWPFQESVHPDLSTKKEQKAVLALVEGRDLDEVREEFGVDWDIARSQELRIEYAGATRGDLKAKGLELERFRPGFGQIAGSVGLVVAGFLLTFVLSGGGKDKERPAAGEAA